MTANRMHVLAGRNRVGIAILMLMLALLAAACGDSPRAAVLTASTGPKGGVDQPRQGIAALQGPDPTATPAADATETPTPAPADGTPAASQPSSGLTAAESDYLDKVDALVNRITNSSELSAVTLAMRDVTQQYGLTGAFDPGTANAALAPAVSFMSGVGADASALQPPPQFKGVQDELQGAVNDENTFLKDSQNALANPSRDSMTTVQQELLSPFGNLLVVSVDSSNRRVKGGLGLPQVGVDSPLTSDEMAYLNRVQALVTRMSNAPELGAALGAFGDDLETLSTTGQLDGKSSSDARAAAIRFMSSLAPDVQALQPPARLQGVQVELLKVVQLYTSGFNDWQAAIVDQKWDKMGSAFFEEVGAAGVIMQILNKDLAFLGVK